MTGHKQTEARTAVDTAIIVGAAPLDEPRVRDRRASFVFNKTILFKEEVDHG